jgi:hypothetical protein
LHVEGDPIHSHHRDGMRGCCGVRIAAAVATNSIRSEHDEATADHRFAGHGYQHATVRRIIDMPATAAGR